MMAAMTLSEKIEFQKYWWFFTPEALTSVPRSGESIVDISAEDLEFLHRCGLLLKNQFEPTLGLKMHIFTVPEVAKRRRRLIIHTIDINNFYDCPSTAFQRIEICIEETTAGSSWFADAAAYYHQFKLPTESLPFFTFATPFGNFTLTTIATGQRHAPGAAQCLSSFLLRHTATTVASLDKDGDFDMKSMTHSAYIDNFRMTTSNRSLSELSASVFITVCTDFGVTINESLPTIIANMSKSNDFRGVRFNVIPELTDVPQPNSSFIIDKGPSVSQTTKTIEKLRQILDRDLPEVRNWAMSTAESIFGLLIFASAVIQLDIARFFYVYKFDGVIVSWLSLSSQEMAKRGFGQPQQRASKIGRRPSSKKNSVMFNS
jgi:hypothetical protein